MRSVGSRPPRDDSGREIFGGFLRRAPKQSRSRALVDAILTALEERLASAPRSDAWTIEDVIERAGVGVGSYYEYFASKDSMLGALATTLTHRNFVSLLAVVDRSMDRSLEEILRCVGMEVARTYLERPRTTRTVLEAIGRLGLMHTVVVARDRFAEELARRAQPFFPSASPQDLAETFRIHADATMGIISGEVLRDTEPQVDVWGERFAVACLVMLRTRHGEPVDRSTPRDEPEAGSR